MIKRLKYFAFLLLFTSQITIAQNFALTEVKAFTGYDWYVRQGKFSPYGNYIALTIGDNRVELYDKNYKKLWSQQGNPESVGGLVAFSPDEKYLAFTKYKTNADIGILRMSDLQVIQTLSEHQDFTNTIAYSPDGKFLVSTSDDYSVQVWKWDGSKFIDNKTIYSHTVQSNAAAFSPDGQLLITAFQDGVIKVFQLKDEKFSEVQTLPGNKYSIETLTFHPSGKYFASGGSDMNVTLYERAGTQFKLMNTLTDERGSIYRIAFSPDGKFVAATRSNSTVKVWSIDGTNFKEEKVIARHNKNVFDVDFSNDGKYMSTSSSDGSTVIFSLDGVGGSPTTFINQNLGSPLTSVQRKILIASTPEKIISKMDKSLSAPRDEFETKQAYEQRKEKLKSHILLLLQQETELAYGITLSKDKTKVFIKPEKLGSYNADEEVYTFYFLETTAKVTLPVAEAKSFKESWQKGKITANKTLSKDGMSYSYSDFQLAHPTSGKTYTLTIEENPFTPGQKLIGFNNPLPDRTAGGNDIVDPALYENSNIPGVHYALLFGTNDYDNYNDLTNPVNDAKTIAAELEKYYGFKVEVVENPTLDEIVAKLRSYAQMSFNPKDQLFIFFAGHGKYDEIFKEGYLVTKQSRLDDETKTTLLSHSNLRTIVNNIPCDHIFLTMDVCFGGTFDPLIASRGTDVYTNVTKSDFIDRKLAHKTRLYLTSGGKEYVPDGRPGEHSPFARKLLEALRSYGGEDGILTTGEIITYVEKVVPQPRTGEFGNNEPGSDFIFIAK